MNEKHTLLCTMPHSKQLDIFFQRCPASNIVTLALSPGKWNRRWEFFQCQISCNCICTQFVTSLCCGK